MSFAVWASFEVTLSDLVLSGADAVRLVDAGFAAGFFDGEALARAWVRETGTGFVGFEVLATNSCSWGEGRPETSTEGWSSRTTASQKIGSRAKLRSLMSGWVRTQGHIHRQ